MKEIPDRLKKNLNILFVGFNPSIRSSQTGHHYANPSNRFWSILYQSGLTPKKFTPDEDEKLLELGLGLTNIVARPTKGAADIKKLEYEHGSMLLQKKIIEYKPKVVCFVGKGVYQEYAKKRNVSWGKQDHPFSSREAIEFVAPSSSGLVRMKMNEIVDIYRQLNNYI
ncbi:G/U mismatch-specific DNA glycosylase [Aquibacillus sp. 3ASR75-11]|uniref:G/U mismatch-specific DNA glycosylase n=1 Tax=Terrihalobacillus insolitus TaxID=2950438 RepID=A0A9X4AMB5_9BACI|nr:G/U mismatch-specific DNA glycosylase [Terrihalobacillus insolitus]MDC3413569.1 G/U mismatch-specific DNA glycosylase [Terrihalobacillus insolitus]MDC3424674.1 G/U mismatch-specific DNA glycosylase [Terrihalobacillus insolitus]